jgi:hypothetical protein
MRLAIVGNGIPCFLQQRLGLMSKWQQVVPGPSQRYSLMMALKKRYAQVFFQQSQSSGDVLLHRVESLCCLGDVSVAGDGSKEIQIRKLHRHHYSRWNPF